MTAKRLLLTAVLAVAVCSSVVARAPYKSVSCPADACSNVCRADGTDKTIGFYQRMLEQWCRTYFEECFDCKYKKNSLANVSVLSRNDSGTQLVLSGVCSYSGWFDHNDVPFKAFITYKGSENYEILFKKGARSGRISETEASATRSIAYWE